MKRDTLTLFFRRAVLAALPLASAACFSPKASPDLAQPQLCDGGYYAGGGGCMTPGGGEVILDGGLGDASCAERCPPGQGTVTCSERLNSACQPITVCELPCIGRAPSGLATARADGDCLGRYFAESAHFEAASVVAFRRLRAELRALGAPPSLLAACTDAARDEVRHARRAALLTRRFGSSPPPVRVGPARARTMMALAIENAREGCIGETFGALIATWQATNATDAEARAHFGAIVADETRHAELAWSIDGWLRDRLTAAERAHLEDVRTQALADLAVALVAPADAELQQLAGLPSPSAARALHRAFAAEVARRA